MLDSFGPRNIDLSNPISGHPLNYGLTSWWLGLPNNSGGGTLFDLVQTSRNHGTLTNGPTWVPGQSGFGALDFNGADFGPYVDCGDPTNLQFGTGDFTVALWFNADTVSYGVSDQGTLYSKSFTGLEIYIYETKLNAYIGGTSNPTNGTTVLSTGTWYHACLTRSGSSVVLYLNGVSEGTATNSADVSNGGTNIQLGSRTGSTTNIYDGRLSDVRVYSVGLTANEVYSLYEQSLRGHPDTLRRVSSWVWSFGSDGGGAPATTSGYLLLLGVG